MFLLYNTVHRMPALWGKSSEHFSNTKASNRHRDWMLIKILRVPSGPLDYYYKGEKGELREVF